MRELVLTRPFEAPTVKLMRSLVALALLLVFSIGFVAESGVVARDRETHVSGCHSSSTSSDFDQRSEPASHGDDCHCPMHRSSCCHPVGLIFRPVLVAVAPLSVSSVFFEVEISFKQDPFLEGPFQPPRAV